MADIHEFPTHPDEMAAAVDKLRRAQPMIIEYVAILAKMKWAAFEAYKKEGFTDAQALELCKTCPAS